MPYVVQWGLVGLIFSSGSAHAGVTMSTDVGVVGLPTGSTLIVSPRVGYEAQVGPVTLTPDIGLNVYGIPAFSLGLRAGVGDRVRAGLLGEGGISWYGANMAYSRVGGFVSAFPVDTLSVSLEGSAVGLHETFYPQMGTRVVYHF